MRVLTFGCAAFTCPDDYHNIGAPLKPPGLVVGPAPEHRTDTLTGLAHAVHPTPPSRELDLLISVGERISMTLLAMALIQRGVQAVSFTGSQSGIITCTDHSIARIIEMRPARIQRVLAEGKIPIVAGFQGMSLEREVTTLGRGGSDTSAVALALALNASEVLFYKDVPGIFSEDPKKNPHAEQISHLNYSQALSIVRSTGSVLHPRAIELAQKNNLPLRVQSFKRDRRGHTLISDGRERKQPPVYERNLQAEQLAESS